MPVRLPSFPATIAALFVPFLAAALGCTTSETTTDTTNSEDATGAARLKLLPDAFLGDTACGQAPGSMRSYVAKLYRTDQPDAELIAATPVSCGVGVLFDSYPSGKGTELVTSKRRYKITVEGYEKTAAEVDPKTDTPRWKTACGSEKDPIIARDDGATLVEGCDALVDAAAGSSATAVVVDPRGTLGAVACAGEGAPGQKTVASFDVLSDDGLGDTLGVACSADAPPITIAGKKLVPGSSVSFFVAAHASADGPLTYGATCSAVVQEGLTVTAACAPLTSYGTVLFDLKAILAQFDITCGADFSTGSAVVTVGDQTFQSDAATCDGPLKIGPFGPGTFELVLTVPGKDGNSIFTAKCEGSIEPSRAAAPTSCVQL